MAQFLTQGKKIVAIGRNYLEHVKELGNTVPPEPFFFLKPTTSYTTDGIVEVPKGVLMHHEIELGVVIGKRGRDITEAEADSYIAGYTLSIDMTARNMQEDVKKRGLPWTTSKGFDTFCPTSPFIPREKISDPHNLKIWLKACNGMIKSRIRVVLTCLFNQVNGEMKQDGNTADMINSIPRLIQHISSIMTLEEGDLILTGTPSGVGLVNAGDKVTAGLSIPGQSDLLALLEVEAIARNSGYAFKG